MNKPRLIDANKLYKLIEENSYTLVDRINSKDKGMFLTGIKQAIDMQPTAYDVDAVVERLEEIFFCSEDCSKKFYQGFGCKACLFGTAIEIVKGGNNV